MNPSIRSLGASLVAAVCLRPVAVDYARPGRRFVVNCRLQWQLTTGRRYAGMLRAVEEQRRSGQQTLHGKIAMAELAESVQSRLCRVLGGSCYTHDSPFGYWLEDIRALSFLRPPWAYAYQAEFDGS